MRSASCFAVVTLITASLAPPLARAQSPSDFDRQRDQMVDEDIVKAGIQDPRVVHAMRLVPRHEFVPQALQRQSYLDVALLIGNSQTISPPFIVAYMTEQLEPQPNDRVLEIGTGSGYQAAVLSGLVSDVYTIEIVEPLGKRAAATLRRLGYDNVHCKVGDGFQGWPTAAPFDKIIVTCSPEDVPQPLVDQLRDGGRMIIPIGERYHQMFYLLRKENGGLVREALIPTLFVPMTGIAEGQRRKNLDPANPAVLNSGFEELLESDSTKLKYWHYQRQMEVFKSIDAPEGHRYATFSNSIPGQGTQALQGMALDGRIVRVIDLSCTVKGNNIHPGQHPSELPRVAITFFDDDRSPVSEVMLGPWQGSFDWQNERRLLPVPRAAREAMINIGMYGATGELGLDDVRLEVAETASSP